MKDEAGGCCCCCAPPRNPVFVEVDDDVGGGGVPPKWTLGGACGCACKGELLFCKFIPVGGAEEGYPAVADDPGGGAGAGALYCCC